MNFKYEMNLLAAVVMVAQGQFSYMISPRTHASYIVSAVVDQNGPTDGTDGRTGSGGGTDFFPFF